jgi:hypothetical protein
MGFEMWFDLWLRELWIWYEVFVVVRLYGGEVFYESYLEDAFIDAPP